MHRSLHLAMSASVICGHQRRSIHVRFSNRPFGVKRFQTIHHHSVDVAHGLVLLFGIGTRALPSWDSKTRRNNLYRGLAVRRTAGQSGHANSPHPSSREGHHSTAGWSSSFLLLDLILPGFHAAAAAPCSLVQRNSVPLSRGASQGLLPDCCAAHSTSVVGHSRPMHSVPVPINVRCYSNSDIIVRRSEVTLRARKRLMHCNMMGEALGLSLLFLDRQFKKKDRLAAAFRISYSGRGNLGLAGLRTHAPRQAGQKFRFAALRLTSSRPAEL